MEITRKFIGETTLKALISLIPFAGGTISSVLSDTLAERKQQRLNDFLTQLKEDLEKCKNEIDESLIKEDDFLDIFELTSRKVLEERNEVKRIAYKNIIINGVTKTASNFDDIEQSIRLIENTTESNIYLLKVFSNPESHNKFLGEPIKQSTGNMSTTTLSQILQKLLPGWDGGYILENLKDLEFLGLILPISNTFQAMITANGLSPIVNSLTQKGERFVSYIKR